MGHWNHVNLNGQLAFPRSLQHDKVTYLMLLPPPTSYTYTYILQPLRPAFVSVVWLQSACNCDFLPRI